jgi:uncharacterized membrane protein
LTVLAVGWVLVAVAAPVALARGYALFPAVVYEAGGLICHQRPERSFRLAAIQLPVCARCFGLYVAGAAGALGSWVPRGARAAQALPARTPWTLAIAALPTAVTVALEWGGLLFPGNAARALAALPLGAAAGHLFVRALASSEGSLRRKGQLRYHP